MKKRLSLCIRYWKACNNNCSFCFEKNDSFNDMFFRPSKEALDANNYIIDKLISEDDYDFYTFKIMGGELFAYPYIANELKNTILKLHNIYKQKNLIDYIENNDKVPESLVIASNLLYKNKDSLKMSLDALSEVENIKATMMVSYDLFGRFNNEESYKLYFENYKWVFENYFNIAKPVVSFILSNQNMSELLNNKNSIGSKIFDSLYNLGAPFDMSLLLNDSHINDFKYDKELFDRFIDLMLTKYPRLLSVYRDTKQYRRWKTIRKTIQGGKVLNEEGLYTKSDLNCLTCRQYKKCHHSYCNISYNVYDCDVKRILEKCESC